MYDRKLKITPKLFRRDRKRGIRNDTVFSALFVAGRLSKDNDEWGNFVTSLSALVERYEIVDLNLMGFPIQWEGVLRKGIS
ncbi:hypothetical protein [Natranaerobius trueperi]|uniref:hypothetical protein n=1 Tax=Natranaerobius trueperi TaxID=759412 RepID=UPI001F0A9131|nr:hypothetical protein [Natranaerobius trueperi]